MQPLDDIHAELLGTLKRYWGYDSFRPVQEEIIRSVCQGRDTLALMPTGGGKSLTYQVPTMLREGLCIVVTPLIALMKDQVDRLRRLGINAAAIHSGLSMRQIDIVLDNCVYGDVKFLYVAPERRIAELRERLPEVPVLALTASATPAVARDIMRQLRFAEPHVLRSSFARPNLSYAVRHDEDKNEQLLRVVRNVAGSGIVYVRTRDGCEQLTEFLRDAGVAATCYHGGLANAERSIRQEEWLAGRTRIMVATNAFGMGIDKADVRFVVHYSMPDSLESYYQEAGRAGRDGKRAYAVLLVAPDDAERVQRRFDLQFPPLDEIRDIYEKVCSYLQIGIGEGAGASFLFNIHDFCTREHLYVGTVQSALKLLQQNGYLTLTDAMENPARLMFCVSRDDLYRLRIRRDDLDHFIRTILRLYNGVFTEFRPIDECELATWSGYKVERVKELLKTLWQLRVIRYIPSCRAPTSTSPPRPTGTARSSCANASTTCSPMRPTRRSAAAWCSSATSGPTTPNPAASATSALPAGARRSGSRHRPPRPNRTLRPTVRQETRQRTTPPRPAPRPGVKPQPLPVRPAPRPRVPDRPARSQPARPRRRLLRQTKRKQTARRAPHPRGCRLPLPRGPFRPGSCGAGCSSSSRPRPAHRRSCSTRCTANCLEHCSWTRAPSSNCCAASRHRECSAPKPTDASTPSSRSRNSMPSAAGSRNTKTGGTLRHRPESSGIGSYFSQLSSQLNWTFCTR